eukprot:TRINITY_DN39352_c0_g1_i1.p1 TRINITY_DN39352_c0_g1~~TRINITY_DN39352_c0_g1_i1.p1  ORF type:complete len:243 (+),score=51.53 TRINITY_DN39352_c0_g1_i1:67-729(+)
MSEAQMQRDRRDKLRDLAMQQVDLNKDKYFMRNHLGHYECRLCLTIHTTEGNYLAHTQGKRHQTNLIRRRENEAEQGPQAKRAKGSHSVRSGWPAYQVQKKRTDQGARILNFQIHYPEIEEDVTPHHRFMSAYEQKKEVPDRKYAYLLFAAEPYETIAFKIPSDEVHHDKGFYNNWNREKFVYTLEFQFKDGGKVGPPVPVPAAVQGPPPGAPPPDALAG